MGNKLTICGKIMFEPENKTKKHNLQASWKHIAMVFIDGDITEYYAWFVKKRYNVILNPPLRGGHISFINDSFKDMSLNGKRSIYEVQSIWNQVKNKWDKKEIPILLDLNTKTDGKHWWLNVHYEYRDRLQGIRNELGLGNPYYGFHLSIGYANEKNIAHSRYIHSLIKNGFIK